MNKWLSNIISWLKMLLGFASSKDKVIIQHPAGISAEDIQDTPVERREKTPPPFGQSKNFHLAFAQVKKRILKYKIEYQTIVDKDGKTKRILHYRERDVSYGLKIT